ncbi:Smr/MutS family protein [Stappia indica]|uniref:Smr/MutS family protein n=1 Tax=Stappia indica TaxID=538381 RepID=UPI001CD4EB49|nr:Smr/MutS family protein [Stappia indica]MCA1299511.1 Smr/MutS family protein [Stappia indica]
MSRGRKGGRLPSPDERKLWAQITAHVTPLPGRSVRPEPVEPETPEAGEAPAEKAGRPTSSKTQTALRPPARPAPPPLAPIEPRQRRKLARGTRSIDARIDLHGLTQAEAHVRLRGFLSQAQARGFTLVLVITGKGAGSMAAEGRGILRRVVPQWLAFPEMRSLVVGFEEAHATHGGGGALYVRLRKAGRGGRL